MGVFSKITAADDKHFVVFNIIFVISIVFLTIFKIQAKQEKKHVIEQTFYINAFEWNDEQEPDPVLPEKIANMYKLTKDYPTYVLSYPFVSLFLVLFPFFYDLLFHLFIFSCRQFKFEIRFAKNVKSVIFKQPLRKYNKVSMHKYTYQLNMEIFLRVNFAA